MEKRQVDSTAKVVALTVIEKTSSTVKDLADRAASTFMNASAQKMTAEVGMDFICPYCSTGSTRFRKAAAETELTADSKRPANKGRHPGSRVALLSSFAVG